MLGRREKGQGLLKVTADGTLQVTSGKGETYLSLAWSVETGWRVRTCSLTDTTVTST